VLDRKRLVQPAERPRQRLPDRIGFVRRGERGFHVLRLPAEALRGDDHVPGEPARHGRSEVHPQQVQAEVQAGGTAAGGEHVTVIDIQLVRADVDRGVLTHEQPGLRPVRGGRAAIKQSGRGQHERARAHGRQVRARGMRRA